jgi:hypothetical protein
MKGSAEHKYTASFAVALAVTSLLSALLVVLKEQNEETVMAWMKAATGHHWVSHGVLVLIIFLLLGWALARSGAVTRLSGNLLSAIITASVLLSSLIIAGFFI